MKKIMSLLLLLNNANIFGMLSSNEQETITTAVTSLTRSVSCLDLKITEQRQEAIEQNFIHYFFTGKIREYFSSSPKPRAVEQSSPRAQLLQRSPEEIESVIQQEFEDFLVLLTDEEKESTLSGKLETQRKNERLVQDAQVIQNKNIRRYLSEKKDFIAKALAELNTHRSADNHLGTSLAAPYRLKIIKDTINVSVESWLKNIELCVNKAKDDLLHQEDLTQSVTEQLQGELELNLDFLRPTFTTQNKEKQALAQIISMAERALNASEINGNGLDHRTLGETIWTIWSNLCIKIQEELNITLTEHQLETFKDQILQAQQTLIKLWCKCAQNSAIGMANEGKLPAKFKQEEEERIAHEKKLKERGLTIKGDVDREGLRIKKSTGALDSDQTSNQPAHNTINKADAIAFLTQNLIFRINKAPEQEGSEKSSTATTAPIKIPRLSTAKISTTESPSQQSISPNLLNQIRNHKKSHQINTSVVVETAHSDNLLSLEQAALKETPLTIKPETLATPIAKTRPSIDALLSQIKMLKELKNAQLNKQKTLEPVSSSTPNNSPEKETIKMHEKPHMQKLSNNPDIEIILQRDPTEKIIDTEETAFLRNSTENIYSNSGIDNVIIPKNNSEADTSVLLESPKEVTQTPINLETEYSVSTQKLFASKNFDPMDY